MTSFTISQTARSYPALPYQKIKEDILGSTYSLNLNFVGATRASLLNKQYRQKDYVPNVLSFPLDQKNGEIYITPAVAKKESSKYNLTYKGYIAYLFIHGLLHLKGLDHGPNMDSLEKKYLQKYKIK